MMPILSRKDTNQFESRNFSSEINFSPKSQMTENLARPNCHFQIFFCRFPNGRKSYEALIVSRILKGRICHHMQNPKMQKVIWEFCILMEAFWLILTPYSCIIMLNFFFSFFDTFRRGLFECYEISQQTNL